MTCLKIVIQIDYNTSILALQKFNHRWPESLQYVYIKLGHILHLSLPPVKILIFRKPAVLAGS